MSRYERRRQKALSRKYGVGDMFTTSFGRVRYVDPTVVDPCFLCGGRAVAWPCEGGPDRHGVALINEEVTVPLCEACFNSEGRGNALARKIMGNPDMIIQEGGEASPEHIREIADAIKERAGSVDH